MTSTPPDLTSAFPGPHPVSPHADLLQTELHEWLGRSGLVAPRAQAALSAITSHGIARAFPTADHDALTWNARLFAWLAAFDDTQGEVAAAADPARATRRVAEYVHLLGGAEPATSTAYGRALRGILERVRDGATTAQYLRLTGRVRDTLFGILWEAHHFHDHEAVTVEDYCAVRPHTVFAPILTAAAEPTLGYHLTDEQRGSTAVRQLEEAVWHLSGWLNDRVSYHKEARRAEGQPLSLPGLLVHRRGLTPDRALDEVARWCEEQAALAARHVRSLTAPGTPQALARHATACVSVAHSYVWHTTVRSRYGNQPEA